MRAVTSETTSYYEAALRDVRAKHSNSSFVVSCCAQLSSARYQRQGVLMSWREIRVEAKIPSARCFLDQLCKPYGALLARQACLKPRLHELKSQLASCRVVGLGPTFPPRLTFRWGIRASATSNPTFGCSSRPFSKAGDVSFMLKGLKVGLPMSEAYGPSVAVWGVRSFWAPRGGVEAFGLPPRRDVSRWSTSLLCEFFFLRLSRRDRALQRLAKS